MNGGVDDLTVTPRSHLLYWARVFCSSVLAHMDFALSFCPLAWWLDNSRKILCCPSKTILPWKVKIEALIEHYNLYSFVKCLLLEHVCPGLSRRDFLVIVNLCLELISYPILIKKGKLEVNHCLENVVHHRNACIGSFSHGYMKSSDILMWPWHDLPIATLTFLFRDPDVL